MATAASSPSPSRANSAAPGGGRVPLACEVDLTRILITEYVQHKLNTAVPSTHNGLHQGSTMTNGTPLNSSGTSELSTPSPNPPSSNSPMALSSGSDSSHDGNVEIAAGDLIEALLANPAPFNRSNLVQLRSCIRRLASTFDNRYATSLENMLNQHTLSLGNIVAVNEGTPSLDETIVSRNSYDSILVELFHDTVNWGRIVALFAFTAAMSCRAVQRGQVHMPVRYVNWTVDYVQARLWPWIEQHGGWDGLLEFEQRRQFETDDDEMWTNVKNFTKVAAGAVVVMAALRYLANRC